MSGDSECERKGVRGSVRGIPECERDCERE